MANKNLLRDIPKVDVVLAHKELSEYDSVLLTETVREILDDIRKGVLDGFLEQLPTLDEIAKKVKSKLEEKETPSLRPVFNATGIILHTNLGRACLSDKALKAVSSVACGYSTLEYDLERGRRGSRHDHVESLICKITNAEAAMVVNNNAAAVLIVLSALTKGKEVIVSRGELVEIGGSFRVPEVMEQGGAILKEVGTTNKTHLFDYKNAVNENTGAFLKVHTSNYRIFGFTESVSLDEMVKLGRELNIPVIEDLGSGFLVSPKLFGLDDEPFVIDSVRSGADIVTFSGDKLLGGPQAGIVVGKKEMVEKIKKHPLARAMRIDKLTLSALEATLRSYLSEDEALKDIPVLNMLSMTPEKLEKKAEKFKEVLAKYNVECSVVPDEGQVGGGSVPANMLPSFGVAVNTKGVSLQKLEERLRFGENPVVGHITKNNFILNVLTVRERDFDTIAKKVGETLKECM